MRRSLALFAAVITPAVAALSMDGCANLGSAADASADGTIVLPGPDAGGDDAEGEGGAAITTTLRLANMSPDLGPVDFCWRVTGSGSFTGPVLGGLTDGGGAAPAGDAAADGSEDAAGMGASGEASSDDAREAASDAETGAIADDATAQKDASDDGAPAPRDSAAPDGATSHDAGSPVQVAFGSISPFEVLPVAGTLDLALIAPNQLSCGQPRFVGQVTLDPGKITTVAVMGLLEADAGAESALQMKAFTDEPIGGQGAQLRFIHAALGWRGPPGGEGPAPALSVEVAGVLVVPALAPTEVAAPSTAPPIDPLGYADVPPVPAFAPIELFTQGDAAPHTWTTPFFEPGLLPGTTHTAFVVSLGAGALGIAWCGVAQLGALPPCAVWRAR